MMIVHLDADGKGASHLAPDGTGLYKEILNAPAEELEFYTVEEFVKAFNTEYISDLSYITVISDEEWEVIKDGGS